MDYFEYYKDWEFNKIQCGDYVNGVSNSGIPFENVQIQNIGGGSIGVSVDDYLIGFYPTYQGDTIDRATLVLHHKRIEE